MALFASRRCRLRRPNGGCCSTAGIGMSIFGVVACLTAAVVFLQRPPGATKNNPAVALPTISGTTSTAVDPDGVRAAAVDAAISAIDAFSPDMLKSLYSIARDDVLRVLDHGDKSCENWRKMPNQQCVDPSECGRGWLFRHKELLLGVISTVDRPPPGNITYANAPPEDISENGDGTPEDKSELGSHNRATSWIPGGVVGGVEPGTGVDTPPNPWRAGTAAMVNVVGLREGGDGEMSDCNSEDLSMLLRFQGPEALAEAAIPVTGKCAWTARFRPTMEGDYTLDVTLLNWKGGLKIHRSLCNEVIGQYGEGSVEMDSVTGVPFYGGSEACCALCTRKEGCVGWSATNDANIALVNGKRCVLYSSVVGEPVEDPLLLKVVRSGTPRQEEAMVFLGPSMSIARRWCSDENGSAFGAPGGVPFTIAPKEVVEGEEELEQEPEQGVQEREDEGEQIMNATATATTLKAERDALPLCSSATRSVPSNGRWVSIDDTECHFEPEMIDYFGWPTYDKDVLGVSMPEECFLQPVVAPWMGGEAKFARGGHVWQPHDCRYDIMDTEARLNCFQDQNITRFLDFGDSLISTSRMPRTALWLPTAEASAWSTGKGRPDIGPGASEAGCVGGPIQYYGEAEYQQQGHGEDSGAPRTITNRYCGVEAYWQVQPGQVRNLIKSFKPDVVVANWAIVHRLWHNTFEEFQGFLKELGRQLDGMATQDKHRPRHMFWLSAPFLVSEREPHCVLERALQYNEALRALLEPRGWIECFCAFPIDRASSRLDRWSQVHWPNRIKANAVLDTDETIDWVSMTRKWSVDILDGMHHGQPPTRMLAYVLMHHVCHASKGDQR